MFEIFEDIKHSQGARDLTVQYKIGVIEGGDGKTMPGYNQYVDPNEPRNVPDEGGSYVLPLVLGTVLVAGAMGYSMMNKTKK